MTPTAPTQAGLTDHVPAWSLAVAAMLSVQVSSALSVRLFDVVGTAGTAWLRLTAGALIFLAINRPPLLGVSWHDLRITLVLGIASGGITMLFLAAIERLPLGTAVAIEFLGPLTVAVVRAHDRRLLVWPALALLGVVLMTEPWHGSVDLLGVALAALAAAGWGTYIVLTQQVGDRFEGLRGLSITIPVAALTAAAFGIPQAAGNVTWGVVAFAFLLALLLPVLPMSFELLALRRLTTAAFGTLMALEPSFGLLMGLLLLGQIPAPLQVVGVALVVAAGVGAERRGHREPSEPAAPLIE